MMRTDDDTRKGAPLLLAAATAFLALGIAGCGKSVQSSGVATASGAAAQEEGHWRGREGVREAIALMHEGKGNEARRRLVSVLRHSPDDGIARQLLQQIEGDPREMFGTESHAYVLKEGETLSTVAQRALGNPMLFYALARYNDIAVPGAVEAGQTIQVPGRRPQAQAGRPAPQRPAAPRSQPPASAAPAPAARPPAANPAPQRSAANPAQAARLRGQGLAALNGGQIDRAVGLLRQAAALDPGNSAIRGDLSRALRVQSTVRARP